MAYRRPCPPDCEHCEAIAEDRATDPGMPDDWQRGQDAYERELDSWGPVS